MVLAAGPFIGYGCDLLDCSTSGGSYATIGNIVDFETPNISLGDADASYVQMTDPWKLFLAKLADAGEVKVTMIWSEAKYAHIFGLLRTPYFFRASWNDTGGTASSKIEWGGYYKALSNPIKIEDTIVMEVTIKASGKPTLTAGS
jgi:hypothetical protein